MSLQLVSSASSLRVVATEDAPALLGEPVHFHASSPDPLSILRPHGIAEHLDEFGDLPFCDGRELLHNLDQLELTGRGGGHFPVARKWRTVRDADGGAVVIANGAEGEPGSRKDAALLRLRPHLVLDGLIQAARTVDAKEAVVWLHHGDHRTHAAVASAIDQRRHAGLRDVRLRVEVGPDHYLTGESSSIVRYLSGGPALPQQRAVPAAVSGVNGAPTLVQNVETLAHVALVARFGMEYEPRTLVTIADGDTRTVVEVEASSTLGELLSSRPEPGAVLVGGIGGTWAAWSQVAELALTPASYAAAGISLGAGVLHLFDADRCGPKEAAAIAQQLSAASARQCGPCVFGLPAVSATLNDLAAGRAKKRHVLRLTEHLGQISGRGGCHHPDGAVNMVRSALRVFAEDAQAHMDGRCLHEPRRTKSRQR
jgi:predicted ribosomally synthesized peptide with SipW-like signal peptide